MNENSEPKGGNRKAEEQGGAFGAFSRLMIALMWTALLAVVVVVVVLATRFYS